MAGGRFSCDRKHKSDDPIAPKARIRFEADVSPAYDLFSKIDKIDDRVGPFLIVVPTFNGSESKTLFGTVLLEYAAGNWTGTPNIENPVNNFGQPRDMFSSPTLIIGSEKQSDFLETLRENAIATHVSKLAEAREVLTGQNNMLIAQEEGRLVEAREVLTAQNNAIMATEDGRLASELIRIRQEHAETVSVQTQAHAERVGALRAEQAVQFAEIETGITERRESLVRQENEARELISGQDELIALMEIAAQNDTRMEELRNQSRSSNLALFSSFGKKLYGSLNCRSLEETTRVKSWPLVVDVTDVQSSGMSGKSGDILVVFSLMSEPEILPKIINFSIAYSQTLSNYDLVLYENGTMTGIAVGNMKFGSWTQQGECRVIFGAG